MRQAWWDAEKGTIGEPPRAGWVAGVLARMAPPGYTWSMRDAKDRAKPGFSYKYAYSD